MCLGKSRHYYFKCNNCKWVIRWKSFFLAGRDITINGNITTANGDFTMRANTSTSYGVVSQRGNWDCRHINNTTINAGTGTVSILLMQGLVLQMTKNAWNYECWIYSYNDSATGQITGTSLTEKSGIGTPINISGFDMGAIPQ